MSAPRDTYTHGHHESVLRSHRWRTAENSAGYLLDTLTPGTRVLDVGCGPGTITVDVAQRVAPAPVVGIDREPDVLDDRARRGACRGRRHGHVRRRRRVRARRSPTTRSTSCTRTRCCSTSPIPSPRCARCDGCACPAVWSRLATPTTPRSRGSRRIRASRAGSTLYHAGGAQQRRRARCRAAPAAVGARRRLRGRSTRARRCGASRPTPTATWWGGMWADRVVASAFAEQAVERGFATRADLEGMSTAWRAWSDVTRRLVRDPPRRDPRVRRERGRRRSGRRSRTTRPACG